jgi:hypothetical protein
LNIKGLLKKPKINYTPEKVTLGEIPVARATEEDSVSSISPIYAQAADIKQQLEQELLKLDLLIAGVIKCIPDEPIPIPEEYAPIIELEVLTLNEYVRSMHSTDNRDVLIQEIFEEHHLGINGEPAALYLPVLSSQRSHISEDLASMTNAMSSSLSSTYSSLSSELNTDLQAFADSVEYGSGSDDFDISGSQLYCFQQDMKDSQELREDVLAAAEIAAQVMDSDLWPNLFDSETKRKIQDGALSAVSLLKKFRGLLVIGMTLRSTDYSSVVPVLRDYVQRFIANVQLNIVINTMLSVYRNYVSPVKGVLARIIHETDTFTPKPIIEKFIPTVSVSKSYLDGYGNTITSAHPESVVTVMNDMAEACMHVIESLEDKIADSYICSRKQSLLRKKGSAAIQNMIRMKRTLAQIDTVIAALQTAALQNIDELKQDIAPGRLSGLLNDMDVDKGEYIHLATPYNYTLERTEVPHLDSFSARLAKTMEVAKVPPLKTN